MKRNIENESKRYILAFYPSMNFRQNSVKIVLHGDHSPSTGKCGQLHKAKEVFALGSC